MYDLLNKNLPHRIPEYCSYINHMYGTWNKENFNLKHEIVSYFWSLDYYLSPLGISFMKSLVQHDTKLISMYVFLSK